MLNKVKKYWNKARWNSKLYMLYWALKHEPDRFFYWFGKEDPILKRKIGILEAAKAVCENPPTFDNFYFNDYNDE